MYNSGYFDVIVIGAGHAGCEAAHASAKLGVKTALITLNLLTIAEMSCNPAIGGIAKGHLVREVDALGGIQGIVADETGIQFRLLNKRKGPAVRSPRTQSDKALYRKIMREKLEGIENLDLIQGEIIEIIVEKSKVKGVLTEDGRFYECKCVILTTGTFLNGLIHIGEKKIPAGRAGEKPSILLAENLKALGYEIKRLKTGTPARVDKRSINFNKLERQSPDEIPTFFSFLTEKRKLPQIDCYITYTNEKIHEIIRKNRTRSPLFSGEIKGIGPRYCPSIEDKIIKFPHHERHQIFVEPEGLSTNEIYLNGFSSSMPLDVQYEIHKLLPGLENVHIIRPAYAIEYDFLPPTQLKETLESKLIEGLFHAGQINGTSGYEEAAAQGIIAGINAALKVKGEGEFLVGREMGYMGVLVNDLITMGVDEPYRMFTSRAELRLLFRIDNADERFTPLGRKIGLVDNTRWEKFLKKYETLRKLKRFVREKKIDKEEEKLIENFDKYEKLLKKGRNLSTLIKRPEAKILDFKKIFEKSNLKITEYLLEQLESDIKYEGYIKLQMEDREKLKKLKNEKIPENIDYDKIESLSNEMKERLKKFKPKNFEELKRMKGITPAAISIIYTYIKLFKKNGK